MNLSEALLCDELADLTPHLVPGDSGRATVSDLRLWEQNAVSYSSDYLYVVNSIKEIARNGTSLPSELPLHVICAHPAGDLPPLPAGSSVIILGVPLDASSLANRILGIFDDYQNWWDRMTEAVLSRRPLEKLMDIACEVIKNPIAIFDSSQSLMYHSENFTASRAGTIWDELLSNGSVENNYYTSAELKRIRTEFENSDGAFCMRPRRNPSHEHLMGPIKLEGKLAGSVGLVDVNAPFSDGQMFLVEQVMRQIENELRQQRSEAPKGNPYFLLRIIDGQDIEARVVAHHLEQRRWSLSDPYYLLLFAYQVSWSYSEEGKAVLRLIGLRYPNVLACYHDSHVIVVGRKKDHDVMDEAAREELEKFCAANYLYCGISNCTNDFLSLRNAYAQSNVALARLVAQDDPHPRTCAFSEGFTDYVIDALDSTAGLKTICDPLVLSLWKSDRGNKRELLDSLHAYLCCGRSVSAAARQLFVHRNTLLYRLGVLESLLSVNFEDLDNDRSLQLLLSCSAIKRLDQS